MSFILKDNQPALFHLNSGGNRSRAKFCLEAGIALQLPTKSIIALACTIELLHNASLIHDDIQDLEDMRRGRQAVWKKYGKSHAICAGDVMISAAYGALANIGSHPALAKLLWQTHQAVSITIKGQSQDLDATDSISQQQYEKIAAMKSGPLIQLTLSLPLLMADRGEYLETAHHALQKFAVAYQIVDDLGDWQQDLQQNHLNLINLLALEYDIDEATHIAQNRAQCLLTQCQKELALFPADCAASIIEASQALLEKTRVSIYE
ncbi:polyprenyl synthetase family protein [Psychrobacter sp. TAE2020]|uniref:polyprenyl synthetase family protein n=1 Tax=Psychrobacter sp. TAE2020 TaxID=2846762 RepID=UPI001C10127E|nr:polyprenyl synthetase family protein [Psychrobacter sp. TAE2020]MBU5616380.1 polyprenyl synthetase family protein [Psychrobacter sp. TAE2020]